MCLEFFYSEMGDILKSYNYHCWPGPKEKIMELGRGEPARKKYHCNVNLSGKGDGSVILFSYFIYSYWLCLFPFVLSYVLPHPPTAINVMV